MRKKGERRREKKNRSQERRELLCSDWEERIETNVKRENIESNNKEFKPRFSYVWEAVWKVVVSVNFDNSGAIYLKMWVAFANSE